MENTEVTTISAKASDIRAWTSMPKSRGFDLYTEGEPHVYAGETAADKLASVLCALGLSAHASYDPDTDTVDLIIIHPQAHDANIARTRNSGRSRKSLPTDSPIYTMADAQALDWLESHSESEGMQALGVSRRTYYRRITELRKQCQN